MLTNALAHAIATSLRIAGAHRAEDVAAIELDQYRANDIDADDTSSVRITLADGRRVTAALALTAQQGESAPLIEVRTAGSSVVFAYTDDDLTHPDGRVEHTGRTDLFEQLLDHREMGAALLSPLADTGAYMAVLEAVRAAPDATRIAAEHIGRDESGASPRAFVPDVADWVERTAKAGQLFREAGAPFAVQRD